MSKNAMLVDYQYCTGCQSCEISCKNEKQLDDYPWGVKVLDNGPYEVDYNSFLWDHIPAFSSVCDLCADRVAAGGTPPCVIHCLAQCLEFGPIGELAKKMEKKDHKVALIIP